MTITIIRRNQIIVINKVTLKGITSLENEYLYSMIPFYYRSKTAKTEVDKILSTLGVTFSMLIKKLSI